MGKAKTNTGSISRMHMDAMDNLYVVLEGSKHFCIVPPSEALLMKTMSPSYAVSPDGLAYQFNANHFREYIQAAIKLQHDDDDSSSRHHYTNTTTNAELAEGDQAIIVDPTDQSITITSLLSDDVSVSNDEQLNALVANATIALLSSEVTYSSSHAHFSKLSFPSSTSSPTSPMDASTTTIRAKTTSASAATIRASSTAATTATATSHYPVKSSQFTIRAGEILYLPTGWFHQVTSARGKHVAINYWWRALHWETAVAFELEKSHLLFKKMSKQ